MALNSSSENWVFSSLAWTATGRVVECESSPTRAGCRAACGSQGARLGPACNSATTSLQRVESGPVMCSQLRAQLHRTTVLTTRAGAHSQHLFPHNTPHPPGTRPLNAPVPPSTPPRPPSPAPLPSLHRSVGEATPPDAMTLMQCAPLRSSSRAARRHSPACARHNPTLDYLFPVPQFAKRW
jgi:hypothetical protein